MQTECHVMMEAEIGVLCLRDREPMESGTAILEGPKDSALSHRGSFPSLENLMEFALLCLELVLDQKSLYSFYFFPLSE